MKRVMSILSVLLFISTLIGCVPVNEDKESLKYKVVAGGYALYRYKGSSQKIIFTVPDEYNGQKVIEILDFAIANTEYLHTVRIGKNIEKIGEWGIVNCSNLKEIQVDANNPNFKSVDGTLFNKDLTELLVYPNGKTPIVKDKDDKIISGGIVTVPDTVKKITNNAFYLCGNLWRINFNQGLEEVGNKAFLKCGNLQNVRFPNTLKTIGIDSFSYCDAFTELTIPASVENIGDFAFFSLSSNIKAIKIERKNADGMILGKDWIPNVKDTINTKVNVEFVG